MGNQYLNHLLSSEFEKDALKEITKMLDEEISKPATDRDYDKIEELTDAYVYISGMNEHVQEMTKKGISQLKRRNKNNRSRIFMTHRLKIMLSIACVLTALLILNAFTVYAWDENVFSAIIHFTQNGFFVEFPEEETINLTKNKDDPYGIKAECEKWGLEVEAPTYLPEGFVLDDVEHNYVEGVTNDVNFLFHRGTEGLKLTYSYFYDENACWSIASDNFNLSEIAINGKSAVVSKEDNQCTVIWADGNLESIIYTCELDYEECDKIIASLK